ncbi:hypothetical protein LX16_3845 [Stackebrandtia albiflava]|uniref:Uncharacterized protein n=1 Tax=Stackebrandtia albiflava TaxID=406432 RepID=A0A562UXS7_9ACTN|nr:hypothetical protein [Stackebrandtia albiflava]TWJ10429.1 hypothetical protein LX16_3845 [Stackebrandtia albiflava]
MTTAVDRGELAGALRDAVRTVPGVSRLVTTGIVEVATQVPGGTIPGVKVAGDRPEVHVAVSRLPVEPVAQAVLRACDEVMTRYGDDRPVRVVVADVDVSSLPPRRG